MLSEAKHHSANKQADSSATPQNDKRKPRICPDCDGTGWNCYLSQDPGLCRTCGGKGVVLSEAKEPEAEEGEDKVHGT